MSTVEKIKNEFQQKCELLQQEPEIRFAGLIDSMGNLVLGGMKKGITALEDEADQRKMFMELVLRVATRQDFDSSLGKVEYSASRRKKAVVMSFSIDDTILLVSAEPNVDIDQTAKKIKKICNI